MYLANNEHARRKCVVELWFNTLTVDEIVYVIDAINTTEVVS